MKRLTKSQYEMIARAIKGGQVYGKPEYINTAAFVWDLAVKFNAEDTEFDLNKFVTEAGLNFDGGYPTVPKA